MTKTIWLPKSETYATLRDGDLQITEEMQFAPQSVGKAYGLGGPLLSHSPTTKPHTQQPRVPQQCPQARPSATPVGAYPSEKPYVSMV